MGSDGKFEKTEMNEVIGEISFKIQKQKLFSCNTHTNKMQVKQIEYER